MSVTLGRDLLSQLQCLNHQVVMVEESESLISSHLRHLKYGPSIGVLAFSSQNILKVATLYWESVGIPHWVTSGVPHDMFCVHQWPVEHYLEEDVRNWIKG